MHYKKNNRQKIHSGSFYLSQQFLDILSLVAEFEGQSKSVIIERAILYKIGGENEKSWEKSKRAYKKKKKIFTKKRNAKANKKAFQIFTDDKNALFE